MDKVFVAKPAKHGSGLFAIRAVAKGEVVLQLRGKKIHYDVVARKRFPDNAFQISRNWYIDLAKPGVLGNHSCDPNTGITAKLEMIAIKPIKKGEEITYDYSCCMDKDTECSFDSIRCHCGSKSCRKHIKGFFWLSKLLKNKYKKLEIVQPFLLREK